VKRVGVSGALFVRGGTSVLICALQDIATHCNTLQHTATHFDAISVCSCTSVLRNSVRFLDIQKERMNECRNFCGDFQNGVCKTLQHASACCSHCNTRAMQDTATYACVLQWGIQAYSVNTNEDTFNLGFANRKSLEISDTQNDCRDRALQKERVFRFWTHRNDCRNILWVAVIVTNLSYEHTCHTSPANETCYSKHKEIILC